MPGPDELLGVFVDEVPGDDEIVAAPTSVTAFVGPTADGPVDTVGTVRAEADFVETYGDLDRVSATAGAVRDFFANGGTWAVIVRVAGADYGRALAVLDAAATLNLVCLVAARGQSVPAAAYRTALDFCVRRRAFLIVDAPVEWTHRSVMEAPSTAVGSLGLSGPGADNAAVFYPRTVERDPPCGAIAGAMARADAQRGVWNSPTATPLRGVTGLAVALTERDRTSLASVGVNALRTVAGRTEISDARTLGGGDHSYIAVRRTAMFVEDSVFHGLRWAVFEPNEETLWARIRRSVAVFLDGLFRRGVFTGATVNDAYFVRCGRDTTTQDEIDAGLVNVVAGFAPHKPAEFVVVRAAIRTASV